MRDIQVIFHTGTRIFSYSKAKAALGDLKLKLAQKKTDLIDDKIVGEYGNMGIQYLNEIGDSAILLLYYTHSDHVKIVIEMHKDFLKINNKMPNFRHLNINAF